MEAQKRAAASAQNWKIHYFECMRGGDHEGELANYVCISRDCLKRGLLCSICKAEHQGHRVLPLKLLLAALRGHTEKPVESSEGFQDELQQLEQTYRSILYQLKCCVDALAETFRQLEAHLHEQFAKAKVELLERVQVNIRFNDFIKEAIENKITDREAFFQDIRRITATLEDSRDDANIRVASNFKDVAVCFQKFGSEIGQKLKIVQKSVTRDEIFLLDVNFNQNAAFQRRMKPMSYQFDPLHKSSTIVLDGDSLARQTQLGGGRFAFLDAGIGQNYQKIAFEIVSGNWVGVGIADRKKIIEKKYAFEYNTTGHGAYLFSSNGYTWSHSEVKDNIRDVKWTVKPGDIIEVEYEKDEIVFRQRGTSNQIILKVSYSEEERQDVGFCVNLCSCSDSVRILPVH